MLDASVSNCLNLSSFFLLFKEVLCASDKILPGEKWLIAYFFGVFYVVTTQLIISSNWLWEFPDWFVESWCNHCFISSNWRIYLSNHDLVSNEGEQQRCRSKTYQSLLARRLCLGPQGEQQRLLLIDVINNECIGYFTYGQEFVNVFGQGKV